MLLGHVVGTVWCTRKHPQLDRCKLLLIRPYFYYHPTHAAEQIVAVDLIDAGIGDDVLVCFGAPARWSLGQENVPVDAAVLGLVDRAQLLRQAFEPQAGAAREGPRPLRFIGHRPPAALEWI
jgi:microcompartment protein CcmK/EutM